MTSYLAQCAKGRVRSLFTKKPQERWELTTGKGCENDHIYLFFFVFLSTWRSGVEKRGVSFLKTGLFYQMVLVYVLDTWVLALLDGWNLFICRYFFALAEIIYSYLSNKRRVGKGLEKYIKIINEGSGSSKGILYYYILNKEVKSLK